MKINKLGEHGELKRNEKKTNYGNIINSDWLFIH